MKIAFTIHPQEPTPTKHAPTPVRQEPLPFCRPDITEAEINEVVDTLHSGWLTTGPKTKAFEGQFADFVEARHAIAAQYDAAFQDVPEIERPLTRPGVCHAWHLYAIRLDLARLTIDRGQFIEALKREGICTSVHFIPLHRQPYYRDRFGLKPGDFPVADVAYERLISLPLYSCMKPRDVTDVIEAVHRVVERHRV